MVGLKYLEPSQNALNKGVGIFKEMKMSKLEILYSIPKLDINFVTLCSFWFDYSYIVQWQYEQTVSDLVRD